MSEFVKKIKITANTAEAETAIAKVELQMKEFSESLEHFQGQFGGIRNAASEMGEKLERLGLISVFAEGGIIGLTNKIADMGYELGETSIKTGLTTEQLQYWQYAAKQSGVDAEQLTNAFRFMNVAMGEARNKTSLQSQAFRYLGISLKDTHGRAKDTNTVFIEVMKRLGSMRDVAMKNRVAMILYSRSYLDLLPLMKSVSEGSKENAEDFKRYGFVLSEDAIKQSEEFHRASINLQTALGSLADAIGTTLIPIIQPLIKDMANYVAQNRKALASDISGMIIKTAQGFKDAYNEAQPFLHVMGFLVDKMGGLKNVILAVAGYLVADLAVSFAQLTIQIGLGAVALGRFIVADVIANFGMLLNLVQLLRKAFIALDIVMILNPIGLLVAGIASAIGLVGFALYKLVQVIKQIKQTFNGSELLREIGVIGRGVAGLFENSPRQGGATNATQGNFLSSLSPAAAPAAAPIIMRNTGAQNNKTNNLNVHLKIDSEGRPTIQDVQSSQPITFTSALGLLR